MKILTTEERDCIFNTLTPKQKDFLEHHVKRGKKTVFANILAKDKGIILPDHATNDEIEHLLEEWVLVDYIDNGFVNPNTPCECGKPLRYQYIVRHKATNEIRRFGKTHFKEHTGLPAHVVKEVIKGFDSIDYEMDELLIKIQNNWSIDAALYHMPENFTLSKDIKEHLDHEIPLLERQIKRLIQDILIFERDYEYKKRNEKRKLNGTPNKGQNYSTDHLPGQSSIIFDEEINQNPYSKDTKGYELTETVTDLILKYVGEGISSVRIICEMLIQKHSIPNHRYITNKPKIYPYVCVFLETLVVQGIVRIIDIQEYDDRHYIML